MRDPRVIRHAIVQFKPRKGLREQNLAHIREVLLTLRAQDDWPDVLVLPEASLSGYFLQGGVRELAVDAETLFAELAALHKEVFCDPLDVVIGFFERSSDDYFNSCLYAEFGTENAGIRHVHRKVFLPTYGVFDEDRFLSRGGGFEAFDTRFGRVGMCICEDFWHSITATILALKGASILYVPVASPVRGLEGEEPANAAYWRNLVRGAAGEHGVYVASSCLVGFEGGKALTGASMLAHPDGHLIAAAEPFVEEILLADVYCDALIAARYDNPLLADLRATLPRVLPSLLEAVEGEA